MRNGETKLYRGKNIKKISGTCYMVPGYLGYFGSYYEAKDAIDAAKEEDRALDEIEARVQALGGYLRRGGLRDDQSKGDSSGLYER